MTKVYFIRHAQCDNSWTCDESRPLTQEGQEDAKKIINFFKGNSIDYIFSSPYKRTKDTITPLSEELKINIEMVDDFRERKSGEGGNTFDLMQKRWNNFNFCEFNGECLKDVQKRIVYAFNDILLKYKDKNIIVVTHGTALFTLLNYFDKKIKCEDYLRCIDFYPYIIQMDFEGNKYIQRAELYYLKKEYK